MSDIKFLLKSDNADNDTNFTDSSGNNVIQKNGGVKHSVEKNKKNLLFNTSVIKFNGTDSYLRSDTALDWHASVNSNFYMECLVYETPNTLNTFRTIFSINQINNGNNIYSLGLKSPDNDLLIKYNGTDITTSSIIKKEQWYHIIVTYINNVLNTYVNGLLVNTNNTTLNTPLNGCSFIIGAEGSDPNITNVNNFWNGYMNNIIIYDTIFEPYRNGTNVEWGVLKKAKLENIKQYHKDKLTLSNITGLESNKSIDGNVNTKYYTINGLNSGVIIKTKNISNVINIDIVSGEAQPGRDPKKFTIHGSDRDISDGNIGWNLIASDLTVEFTGRRQKRTITFNNDKQYTYYRILFTELAGTDGDLQFSEITFYSKMVSFNKQNEKDLKSYKDLQNNNINNAKDFFDRQSTNKFIEAVGKINDNFQNYKTTYNSRLDDLSTLIKTETFVEIKNLTATYYTIVFKYIEFVLYVMKRLHKDLVDIYTTLLNDINATRGIEVIIANQSSIEFIVTSDSNNYAKSSSNYKIITDEILTFNSSITNAGIRNSINEFYVDNTIDSDGYFKGFNRIFSDIASKQSDALTRRLAQENLSGAGVSVTDGYINTWNDSSDVVKEPPAIVSRFKFSNKQAFIDSGDRTKRLANIQIMKSINSKSNNYIPPNKQFQMKNGEINKFKNHSTYLNISRGFSLLNNSCRLKRDTCYSLNDSNHTFTDLSRNVRLDGGGIGRRGYQTNFKLDKCNIANGLLPEVPQLKNYERLDFNFNLKQKISKFKNPNPLCESEKEIVKNVEANPHEIGNTKEHSHYFPISQEEQGTSSGYFTHRHENNPHTLPTVPNFVFNFFTDRYGRFPQNFIRE